MPRANSVIIQDRFADIQRRRSGSLLRIVLFFAIAVPCASARVAPWCPQFEYPFLSRITTDTLEIITSQLTLSDAQVHAIEQEFEAHRNRFQEFVEENQPKREKLDTKVRDLRRSKQGHKYIQALLQREKKLAKVADRQRELDRQYFKSIKPYLTEEQRTEWPSVMRRIRRQWWLDSRTGRYAEERIDLIHILEDIADVEELPDLEGALEQTLHDYSVALDKALRSMVEFEINQARHRDRDRADQYRIKDDGTVYNAGRSIEEMNQQRDREFKRIEQVADTNRRYRDRILPLLPAEVRAEFRLAYYDAALNVNMRLDPPPSDFFLEDVRDIESLSKEQREAIDSFVMRYHQRIRPVHEELLDLQRKYAEGRTRGMKYFQPAEWEKLKEQVLSEINKRYEYENRLIENVWSMLTPEQRKQVKKKPPVEFDEKYLQYF